MKSVHKQLRDDLLAKAGLLDLPQRSVLGLAELERTEWSPKFEKFMRNRLIMGALRYGRLNQPGKPQYDRLASIIRRAEEYRASGNDELLCDIANLALLEFEEGQHPQKHFRAADEREHVARI